MASSIADLVVNVSANIASLQQGLDRASSAVAKFGGDITKSLEGVNTRLDSVGESFKGLAATLGVGLSVAFFKDIVTSSIEAQASLADLGLKAGVSAEQLSALAPAARLSNTSLQDVALGAGKFAKSLVDIAAGTGQGVQVFRQLGLSAQDAARFLKDPAQGLQEVSARMAQFADDGTKVAAAQILLGKSGAQLLPFLHDLAEVGSQQAAVSNEQAAAAKRLQDEWTLLQIRSDNLKNAIVAELVPSLTALVKAYADATSAAGGLNNSTQDLIKNGQVAAWAQEAGANIAKFADLVSDGPRLLRPYAESLGLVITGLLDLARAAGGAFTAIATGGLVGLGDVKAAYDDFIKNLGSVKQAFKDAEAPQSTKFFDAFTTSLINIQLEAGKTATTVNAARPSFTNLQKDASDAAAGLGAAAAAYDKALAAIAKAQSDAGAAVAQVGIKNQLEDLQRAFDQSLVSFRDFYNQRTALQTQALGIEEDRLRADIATQTDLLNTLGQQLLDLKPKGSSFKDLADYAAAYYKAATQVAEAQAKLVGLQGQLSAKQKEGAQIGKDYVEQLIRQSAGLLQNNRALDDAVTAQERQNQEIGLTRSQITLLNIARVEELRANTNLLELTPELQAFYDKQIDGLRRLGEAQARGEGTQRLVDGFRELDTAAQGVFENIFEKGQNVFQQLGQSIKKFVLDLIYQLTVKPIIVNLFAQVTGNAGLTGALTGATQPGGLLGLLTQGSQSAGGLASLFGGGGGLAGLATSFATSGIGSSLGLSTTLLGTAGAEFGAGAAAEVGAAAAGAAGTALTAAGTTLVAAIPVVGWAVAAAAAIYSIIQSNKKPSPTEGQFAFRAPNVPASEFEDNAFTSSRFGNIGFLDQGTRQFSGEAGQVLNKQISGLLDIFAARESDLQITQTATALQGTQFPHFSGTFSTEDFIAKYGDQILKQVATTAFDVLDPALGKVIAGFQGTGQALTTFIGNLIVFHDLAAKLPTDVAANLEAAIGTTQDGLNKVTTFAAAFLNIQDVLNGSPLDDALASIKAQSQSAADVFDAQGTALQKLIDNFDNSATAATGLANATQSYYNAEVQLIAQIEQVKTSISGLFTDTIRSLTLTTLDNAGKGNYLNTEIGQLQDQLFSATDPAQIQALASRINQDINQLFGLLTPEEQQAQLGTFTDNIRQLNDEVTQRLNDVESGAESTASSLLTQIQTALGDAIQSMADAATAQQNAADSQQNAADTMQNAVNTPITVEPVVVFVPTSSGETNG